jgi:hypothetical protein
LGKGTGRVKIMSTEVTNSHESSEKLPTDFSKTRKIVLADLTIKAVSAIAVVVIGGVGFLIQRHLQNTQAAASTHEKQQREEANARDQEEQAYLPFFRSISEVDLALEEISSQFGWPKYTQEEADRKSRLGTRLAYIADSLYFPASESAGGPEISIRTAAANAQNKSGDDKGDTIRLSVEDAVRLLSEVLRISPMLHQMNRQNLVAKVDKGSLVYTKKGGEFVDSIPLEERTVAAFKTWLGQPIDAGEFYTDVDPTGLADEIGKQLAEIAKKEIKEHPKLADKYIVIRSDVLRGREQLLSLSK